MLVNTAAQRLYMYEDGRIVDGMRVVVGKAHQPTPMMAATIKFTALNPYWQVPSDLAAERVAPNVVKEGLGYLERNGYVLLSDWGDQAQPVDPSMVDWEAVAAGKILVRLRQNPGPGNAMGRMKFMFPNPQGIYLHDTPNKELLNEEARLFSGGCVRLEDAPRLAKWLYGRPLELEGRQDGTAGQIARADAGLSDLSDGGPERERDRLLPGHLRQGPVDAGRFAPQRESRRANQSFVQVAV